ncbi:MAG: ATP-binding protein [Bacteroidales bacterium]|nr:ATP-binding protein [Bacteroidales bacterium]
MRDIASHLLDLFQNAITAKATRIELSITENSINQTLTIICKDNGKGMESELCQQADEPFITTKGENSVGLGLALLKQNAEMTGGKFDIQSSTGKGTTVTVQFISTHLDCKPLGDIAGTLALTIGTNSTIDFSFHYQSNTSEFNLTTPQLKKALTPLPLHHPQAISLIKELIISNISD